MEEKQALTANQYKTEFMINYRKKLITDKCYKILKLKKEIQSLYEEIELISYNKI